MDLRIANILSQMFGIGNQPSYPMDERLPGAGTPTNSNFGMGQPSPTMPNQGVQSPQMMPQQMMPQMGMNPQFSHDAQDQLKQMLMTMPQRSQYQPSTMQKILGAIAGLGTGSAQGMYYGQPIGYQSNIPAELGVQDAVQYRPFNQAMSDWETKLKPVSELANTERYANANERIFSNQQAMRGQAEERIGQSQERIDETKRYHDSLNAARKYNQDHPEMKGFVDSDGMLVFVNPRDPSQVTKTEVDTGKMSDADKLEFGRGTVLQGIAARGNEARQTQSEGITQRGEETRQTQTEGIQQRGEQARQTKQTLSGTAAKSSSAKSISPGQQKQDIINKANEMISRDPDSVNYIEFDKATHSVRVKPSSSKLDEAKRMEIFNGLFGKDINLPSSSAPVQTMPAEGNKIRVRRKADGKTGTILESDFDASKYEKM